MGADKLDVYFDEYKSRCCEALLECSLDKLLSSSVVERKAYN